MNKNAIIFSVAGLIVGLAIGFLASKFVSGGSSFSGTLKNDVDSISYCLGVSIGTNVKPTFDPINSAAFAKALEDVYAKSETIKPEQANMLLNEFYMKSVKKKGEKNKKIGADFLENNKKESGVMVTASGLQYKVIKEGNGKQPIATDKVTVHYTGKMIDGTVFDSSVERGQPASFTLNQVIPGWTEGLMLMKEGAKYQLFIPSELGYGEMAPQGSKIESNSVLIFEVELIKVEKGDPASAMPQMPQMQMQ